MSRRELAAAMGVSAGSVKAWELGYREAGVDSAAKAAEVLGCSVAELLGESPVSLDALMFAISTLDHDDRAKVAAFVAGLRAAKR